MDSKNFSARMEIGVFSILIMAFAITFIIPVGVLGSSNANESNVYFKLRTSKGPAITGGGINEILNFTVNNTNNSLLINVINITVPPAADGNATFMVDVSTISFSSGLWNCTNASSDGVGNASLVRCNTSSGNELGNGSVISIWFNATAPNIPNSENLYEWNVTAFNATAVAISKNLTFAVDNRAPVFSDFGANATYVKDDILLWVKVVDFALLPATFNVTIVNITDTNQIMADPSDSCVQLTYDTWNCSAVFSPSVEMNYTFNVNASDMGGSNGSTYDPNWFFYDGTPPTINYESATTSTAGNYPADYLYANISASDTYLDTITIFLYNSTAIVNSAMSTSSPFFQNFTGLPNEFYYLNATVNDSAGNAASTATRTIVLDSAPPSITIHLPKNISYGSGASLPLNFSASDNLDLDSCWYTINSTSNTTLAGCANATLSLSEGFQNVTVYVNDTTGNLNSAARYFAVDLTVPTVTLISPKADWDADGDGVYFYYKPEDSFSTIKNCSLWMSGLMGMGWSVNKTNTAIATNQTNNFSVSGMSINATLGYGQFLWNVQCFDNASRPAFSSANFSIFTGSKSNIIVRNITPDKSLIPFVGINMSVDVVISNNGTANVANMTNVTFCFGTNAANPCVSPIYSNNSEIIPAANLQVNDNHTITYNITVTGSGGDYYIKVIADPENNEQEQYDGTAPISLINDNEKIVKFSTNLNVTILSVTSGVSDPKLGENVTVNVSVLYDNGAPVTGLLLDNFSISDRWMNDSGRLWEGKTSNDTFYEFDFSQSGAGMYKFKYTIPAMEGHDIHSSYVRCYAEYGLHYIRVRASENSSGRSLSGTSPDNGGSYYMIAPYIRVSMNSFNMDPGDPQTYKTFTVYNDGSDNFTAQIDLTIARTPTSGMTVGIDDPNISVSEILDGFETMTNIVWLNPSAEGIFTVRLNASTTHEGNKYYFTRVMTIDVENASTPADDPDDGDGVQPPTYDCTTNASCASTKWCDNGQCVSLSCPTGYYASNHICKLSSVYEVGITEYPKSVYVLQGGSADTNITVKNTGNQDLTMMLEVEADVPGVDVTTSPESLKVIAEKSNNFSAHFEVDENTTIGNYSSKFKITTSSTATDTVSFTLVIQPLAETIERIKADYENYTRIVEQLLAEFNTIKISGFVAGENLTLLEAKVNATRLVFENAKAAMDSENYIYVSSLLDDMRTLVNQTRTLMDELGVASVAGASEFWNTVIMWLVVGIVCIGAVGLLIYMLVPPQGYAMGRGAMGRGYGAGGKGNVVDKAKNMLSAMKGKVMGIRGGRGGVSPPSAPAFMKRAAPAYKSGYKKLGQGYKPEATGLKDKFKRIIKKQ